MCYDYTPEERQRSKNLYMRGYYNFKLSETKRKIKKLKYEIFDLEKLETEILYKLSDLERKIENEK